MEEIPPHIAWLRDTGQHLQTACGRNIEIWELAPKENEAILSAWAKYFREHYITDDELPLMVNGTGLCQRRSKISPKGGVKLYHFDVYSDAMLRVVPVVHRRDPRCFV